MAISDEQLIQNVEEAMQMLSLLNSTGYRPVPRQMTKVKAGQVQNKAGGYVFTVDDKTLVLRFLILGTTTSTYYTTETEATEECLEELTRIINEGKGAMILSEIIRVSSAGIAPKQTPCIYALALCARYQVKDRRNLKGKKAKESSGENTSPLSEVDRILNEYLLALQQAALMAANQVCNIPTHLFAFVKYCDKFSKKYGGGKGWGRAMRTAISDWYLSRPTDLLAMHITKYKNREGYTHRDLFRLAHPKPEQNHADSDKQKCESLTLVYDQIFNFACNGTFDEQKKENTEPLAKRSRGSYTVTEDMQKAEADSSALRFLRITNEAAKLTTTDEDTQRCVEMIRSHGLVREHIPTNLLNSVPVWLALLEKMPMTAMLRNLSKMSALGIIDGSKPENERYVEMVVSKVLNEDLLHKAKIHPISVLLASSVYSHGRGQKGSLTWTVNPKIEEALNKAFTLAFKNVEPTGKRYLLAMDVSGSMSAHINGGVLSCRTASAAMATVFLQREQNVQCMAFCDTFTELPFTSSWSVKQIVEHIDDMPFGSTDCSLPMIWAAQEKREFDVFIIYTDNETWAGELHAFEALKQYRKKMNIPDAKLIVCAMSATKFTIADPSDPGMLDVVGLDSSVPEVVRNFVNGDI